MSGVARPARCLFCAFSRPSASASAGLPLRGGVQGISFARRQFSASIWRGQEADGQSGGGSGEGGNNGNANVKENGSASQQPPQKKIMSFRDLRPEHFRDYSAEEKAKLREVYSPQQMAAIEAAEQSIDPQDLADQFALRDDAHAFTYLDDFSAVEPTVDHHIRKEPLDNRGLKMKNPDEVFTELSEYIANNPDMQSRSDAADQRVADGIMKYLQNMSFAHGDTEGNAQPASLVPDIVNPGETIDTLGEKPDINVLRAQSKDKSDSLTPELEALVKVTGYSVEQIRGLRVKTLVSHAVVNQTRLGKIRKSYILSVAGNGNGLLGIGEGKSEDMSAARIQSAYAAIRNMQPILRYEGRTIFGDVKGKVGAVELQLMHRPP
ncbi:28S ribosomal protein S5, mitochondrial, partial [Ascosphaera atra]